jgi:hypothetical protein
MRPSFFLLSALLLGACNEAPGTSGDSAAVTRTPNDGVSKAFHWTYYEYGELPPFEYAQARDAVWARYGVTVSNLGCVVTNTLLQEVKLHNDSLFTLLQPKYPGVSEERILREMEAVERSPKK